MNNDNMLTFVEAWLLAKEGKDTSEAIENQEKRGQASVVRNQRLPKKVNDHTVPREIFFNNVTSDMSYEERKLVTDKNLVDYTRAQYEKMGIEVVDEYDDLFWNVRLPDGWEVKATDHAMWNELRDDKNRKRATFFYKAAFYDRSAFINFETRFNIQATHISDNYNDYDEWRKSDLQGTVRDGEVIICQTRCVPATCDYAEDDKIKNMLYDELEVFMLEHYPEYRDINAYWD